MNELDDATKAFEPIDEFLERLSLLTERSSVPLLLNMGMKRIHRHDPSDPALIDQWPSSDEIRRSADRLIRAFNLTHEVYAELSEEDRRYVKQPPFRPKVRWYRVPSNHAEVA